MYPLHWGVHMGVHIGTIPFRGMKRVIEMQEGCRRCRGRCFLKTQSLLFILLGADSAKFRAELEWGEQGQR